MTNRLLYDERGPAVSHRLRGACTAKRIRGLEASVTKSDCQVIQHKGGSRFSTLFVSAQETSPTSLLTVCLSSGSGDKPRISIDQEKDNQ